MTRAILDQSFRGDHGCVVGAILFFGKHEPEPCTRALFRQQIAQESVRDDAAARGDGFALFFLRRRNRALRKNAARRCLKGSRHVCTAVLLPLLLPGVAVVDDRRL